MKKKKYVFRAAYSDIVVSSIGIFIVLLTMFYFFQCIDNVHTYYNMCITVSVAGATVDVNMADGIQTNDITVGGGVKNNY